MLSLSQSPTAPDFIQDPYAFYRRARKEAGDLFVWEDYDLPCVLSYASVSAILRDRRFGREIPPHLIGERPANQAGFWAVEDHSMLELEPPRHTRLRGLVLRAFTSRRIGAMEPEILQFTNDLLDRFPDTDFDLIPAFAEKIPVVVIARLLGVPESEADQILEWSHAMVGMYQAGRDVADETAAAQAASDFSAFLSDYIDHRRNRPADDLISHLIAAEEDGEKLSKAELIATCILLLNAGHEATVHSIGNAVLALCRFADRQTALQPDMIAATVEETLRFDPPLHLFQRWAYEDIDIGRHTIPANTKVGCLLAAANRDPQIWDDADTFDPFRPVLTNASFGAGVHFCIGAPLARLELRIVLPALFARFPELDITEPPRFAPTYHFHGLTGLKVRT